MKVEVDFDYKWWYKLWFRIDRGFSKYNQDPRLDNLIDYLFNNIGKCEVTHQLLGLLFKINNESWEFHIPLFKTSEIANQVTYWDSNGNKYVSSDHIPSWYNQMRLYHLYNVIERHGSINRYNESTSWLDRFKTPTK